MIIAGTNFTMVYFGIHGRLKKVFRDEEFKFYLLLLLVFSTIVAIVVFFHTGHDLETSFRKSMFQVVSVITTTGFITDDYTVWTPFVTFLFFIMLFLGASSGSTAGGVKIVRHLLLMKNTVLEFKRQLHPSAVLPVRFNHTVVPKDVTFNIMAFIIVYILIFVLGSSVMSALDIDFVTSMGAVASCLGNVGPGIGSVGPIDNYFHIPSVGKWILSFLMILGRLELFTILILFTPHYWKRA